MELLLKYWPIVTAFGSAILSAASFYFYVRWKFKMFNKDMDLFVKSLAEHKDLDSVHRSTVISQLENYSRKQHEIELTMVEIRTLLKVIPGNLEAINKTVEEAFTQIKEIKRDCYTFTGNPRAV